MMHPGKQNLKQWHFEWLNTRWDWMTAADMFSAQWLGWHPLQDENESRQTSSLTNCQIMSQLVSVRQHVGSRLSYFSWCSLSYLLYAIAINLNSYHAILKPFRRNLTGMSFTVAASRSRTITFFLFFPCFLVNFWIFFSDKIWFLFD